MQTREAVALDAQELLELEMILIDKDAEAALDFLKRVVWKKVERARQGRLKCHLDVGTGDPVQEYHEQEEYHQE